MTIRFHRLRNEYFFLHRFQLTIISACENNRTAVEKIVLMSDIDIESILNRDNNLAKYFLCNYYF